MYRCFKCDREFEMPSEYPDFREEFWGAPFTKNYYGCPFCKSGDISEIKYLCDCCGCDICEGDKFYEILDGGVFCEDCVTYKEA